MIEIKIASLNHEGRGITHLNGKTIFVENALPDEVVLAERTKRHSRFDEARTVEVKHASPFRVQPRCQHFSICGGCDLQHLHPDAQIQLKQKTLLDHLKHFGNLHPDNLLPPLRGPEWGYRHKARLAIKYVNKKQKLLIGFHEKNGRFVADLSRCEVLHPKVGFLFEPLREVISALSIYNKIAQIEVAVDDHEVALIFRHIVDLPIEDKERLIVFAKQHQIHVYCHPNKPATIYRLWPNTGDELLSYESQDLHFAFHATDFTQINPAINRQMVTLALQLLDLQPTDHALDLFCGLGNFTLPIAKHCQKAIGIEGDDKMVRRATQNAIHNALSNVEFYTSNLFEPDINTTWMRQHYNKILLDPPRTGACEIIPTFTQLQAKRIVYVSCNPATLARDAGIIVNSLGFRLHSVGVMDMFPHTKHVESIALFTRD